MTSAPKSGALRPGIKVTKDGPYLVSGSVPIREQVIEVDEKGEAVRWAAGREYQPKKSCSLCRCGKSETKPYCDGAHALAGFDGTETAGDEAYLDKPERFKGPQLKLDDVEPLCASARFCMRGAGIWQLVLRSGRPGNREQAIQQASSCPAGRLVVSEPDGTAIEPEFEPSIGVVEDPQEGVSGPLWVRGGIPVESADGRVYRVRNRVTLCRCGKSKNKPFCDGSHLHH